VNRKLTDVEVADLRDTFRLGGLVGELALEYDVSERHVRRLVEGVEREPDPLPPASTVEEAVTAFLGRGVDLDAADGIVAAAMITVARRLDRADARTTPALAGRLSSLIDQLRGQGEGPDALDELQLRHRVRRLAMRAEA